MIDGNVNDFIDKLYYEDHYVEYRGEKFFFNGCCTEKDNTGKIISVRLEVYNLTRGTTVFSTTMPSAYECITEFETAAIWNGKTFWDAENEMQWVDG